MDLFASTGGPGSMIHCNPDDTLQCSVRCALCFVHCVSSSESLCSGCSCARVLSVQCSLLGAASASQVVLGSMLPRESASKELDSALLTIVSYPAFAVTDPRLAYSTLTTIRRKLLVRAAPLPSLLPFLSSSTPRAAPRPSSLRLITITKIRVRVY